MTNATHVAAGLLALALSSPMVVGASPHAASITTVLDRWATTDAAADANRDGTVDQLDLLIVLDNAAPVPFAMAADADEEEPQPVEPLPLGNCCYDDTICVRGVVEMDCIKSGGAFYTMDCGPCDDAPPLDAYGNCCVEGDPCRHFVTAAQCETLGGTFHTPPDCGECTWGDEKITCCSLDGTCAENVVERDCYNAGGHWVASCDECAKTGACCLLDGSCIQTTEANCSGSIAGDWKGAGTSCEEVECPTDEGDCCDPPEIDKELEVTCDPCTPTYQFTPVAGATCADVSTALGSHPGHTGYQYSARHTITTTSRECDNGEFAARAKLTRVHITIDLTITLPIWSGYAGATDAEKAAWRAFLGGLHAHEQAHADAFCAQLASLKTALAAIPEATACGDTAAEAEAAAKAIVAQAVQVALANFANQVEAAQQQVHGTYGTGVNLDCP